METNETEKVTKTKAEKDAAKLAAKQAREAAKAQKLAEKEAAKAAAKQPEQNGVKRPKPGTLCGAVWEIADKISMENGKPAEVADVIAQAKADGLNEGNARIEFARWRKFHGIASKPGRPAKPEADESAGKEAA